MNDFLKCVAIGTVAGCILLVAACGLYRQTFRTERAIEIGAYSTTNFTRSAGQFVHDQDERSAESHAQWIQLLKYGVVAAGLAVAYFAEELKRGWREKREARALVKLKHSQEERLTSRR